MLLEASLYFAITEVADISPINAKLLKQVLPNSYGLLNNTAVPLKTVPIAKT